MPTDRLHWRRDTVLFLSGQTVSLLGSSVVQYAVLWYLTLRTESGVVLTVATLVGFVPQAIVSVFGGVLADRYNRKYLVIIADGTIAITTAALAIMLWQGQSGLWLIYLTLAIRSAGAGIQTPAVSALIPQIVPTQHLMRVNGINMSIQSAMTLISPAVAAALFAALGLQAVLGVDVVTAVVGIALLALIPVATVSADHQGYFENLKEGLSYVRSHRVIRRVLVFYAVVFVLCAPPGYLTPLMVVRTFGDEVWRLTVTEVAFGVGMLAGGLVVASLGGWRDRMRTLVATSLTFGVLGILVGFSGAIIGDYANFWVFLVLMFLFGVAVAYFSTSVMTLLQEQVEPTMQGRVFGVQGIVMALGMPLGMAIFGPVADVISVEWVLVISGVMTIAVSLVAAIRAPQAVAPSQV